MSNQPLTFLTGATGFVGAAVARALIKRGHKLRLLTRANNDRRNLKDLQGVELIEGDLSRPETYRHALLGCHNLFHVAADYRIWVPDPAVMHKINVDGTRQLMECALWAGVEKVVYTSSVATLGLNRDGTPSNEETPVSFKNMVGVYKQSKYLAEQEVQNLIRELHLPCVIVNPSTPIGPRDIKPTPTGRIIVEAALGKIPAYVDTGLNVVHVDDVAEGHCLALERGTIGERYILGGENLGLGEILALVTKKAGRRTPTLKLPQAPLYPLAHIAEFAARFTKKEPFITVDGLNMSKKKMFFSAAKAERDLGFSPRPAKEALYDALSWFHSNGYC